MEPSLPTPHSSPESIPQLPIASIENAPSRSEEKIDNAERGQSKELLTGAGSGDADLAYVAKTPTVPLPLVSSTQLAADNTTQDNHMDSPSAASDDGLIEKEWVDKAKKIVENTKDDPYKQEKEVSKLQANYLEKRYGKIVKIPGE